MRIVDQGSGSWVRDGKKFGSVMSISDHISESLETIFWVKLFDADPDPGSGIFLTLDPGSRMEKFGSGINIPDRNTGCVTGT